MRSTRRPRRSCEDIADGGIVLAKNEAGALPLARQVAGDNARPRRSRPVFGGAGSGSVDTSSAVTARAGLENAGFEVNDAGLPGDRGLTPTTTSAATSRWTTPEKSSYNIGELPVGEYEAQSSTFADYSDAAVVFIGRPGGEGGDLTPRHDRLGRQRRARPAPARAQQGREGPDLTLARRTSTRSSWWSTPRPPSRWAPIQDDPEIDAVLLAGSPGASGFNALGQILGRRRQPVGPHRRRVGRRLHGDPTFANFGSFIYDNLEVSYPVSTVESATSNATVTSDAPFVNYAEGIYIGYRYYETAAVERLPRLRPGRRVSVRLRPQLHGFDLKITGTQTGAVDGTISVTVEVTNTGAVAGKDVVELYYSAPYTKGGIEKPAVVLGGVRQDGCHRAGCERDPHARAGRRGHGFLRLPGRQGVRARGR